MAEGVLGWSQFSEVVARFTPSGKHQCFCVWFSAPMRKRGVWRAGFGVGDRVEGLGSAESTRGEWTGPVGVGAETSEGCGAGWRAVGRNGGNRERD